jgi:hypothetical protein
MMLWYTTEKGHEINVWYISSFDVETYNSGLHKRKIAVMVDGTRYKLTQKDYKALDAIRRRTSSPLESRQLPIEHSPQTLVGLITIRMRDLDIPPAQQATWKRLWAKKGRVDTFDELDAGSLTVLHRELLGPDPMTRHNVERFVLEESLEEAMNKPLIPARPKFTRRWPKGAKQ